LLNVFLHGCNLFLCVCWRFYADVAIGQEVFKAMSGIVEKFIVERFTF